jgi:1-pyrroline-5-carboxylate dehydrogenase
MSSIPTVPQPWNEPVLSYAAGSPEREELKSRLEEMSGEEIEIPMIIGGREIRTGDTGVRSCRTTTGTRSGDLAPRGRNGDPRGDALATEAQRDWASWAWEDRVAIFLRAAELLATRWRPTINAATMLNQSKTAHQAEIDSACELIDFFRFNAAFAEQVYAEQPESSPGVWNRLEHRALEGFIYAITPFNFTAIAANLPSAPAMLGNVAIWKPSDKAIFSGYSHHEAARGGGASAGRHQLRAGRTRSRSRSALLESPDLAGIHYTGSTAVFQTHLEDGRRPDLEATAPIRGWSARRAGRTSSSRTPAPTRGKSPPPSYAVASSTRGRSAAPHPASTCRLALARSA